MKKKRKKRGVRRERNILDRNMCISYLSFISSLNDRSYCKLQCAYFIGRRTLCFSRTLDSNHYYFISSEANKRNNDNQNNYKKKLSYATLPQQL